jgi:hypothetical protein
MKRLLLVVLSLVSTLLLRAQNTALDFDIADCNGNQHHLFEELDNGYIIILQFTDPKSSSSASSSRNIENLVAQYKNLYPDKVFYYTIGADDATTCNDMATLASISALSHSVFSGNRSQSDYYGMTALPAVVVMGNSSHTVYYSRSGYSTNQDAMIKAAIEEAVADGNEAGGSAVIKSSFASVFPNPFSTSLNIRLNQSSNVSKVSICDITGKSLLTKESTAEKLINFSTSSLQKGIYFINFYEGDKITGTFKLVKKQ